MAKRRDVGRGWRTPAKHELLHKMLGRITGAVGADTVERRLGEHYTEKQIID